LRSQSIADSWLNNQFIFQETMGARRLSEKKFCRYDGYSNTIDQSITCRDRALATCVAKDA
jgi:hypothetical protein